MKLLLRFGNGKAKIIDNVTRAEQFADLHQVFEMQENGEMSTPMATVTPRFWLIHSSDLKKPVRAIGFEVVEDIECGNCGQSWNGKTCDNCGYPIAVKVDVDRTSEP